MAVAPTRRVLHRIRVVSRSFSNVSQAAGSLPLPLFFDCR
jgi:hypothetical protein